MSARSRAYPWWGRRVSETLPFFMPEMPARLEAPGLTKIFWEKLMAGSWISAFDPPPQPSAMDRWFAVTGQVGRGRRVH